MTAEETRKFQEKPLARLIGKLPFLAGCDDAERTAVAHLGIYLMSCRDTKPYFHPHEGDNGHILDRLRLIMSFRGGDRAIIDRGMALIGLQMLHDYKRDVEIDAAIGKYNPLAEGAFDFETTRDELLATIRATESEEMDEDYDDEIAPLSYWSSP